MLFTVAASLGGVACASSLFLLYIALDSWNPAGVWAKLGLAGLTYGQVTTMVYLKVSISDFLTLFSSRSTTWFWENKVRGVALCCVVWFDLWMDGSTASLPQSQTTTLTDTTQSHKHIHTITTPNQHPQPSKILLIAAGIALSLSTFLASVWPLSEPDGIPTVGLARQPPVLLALYVWLYCLACWIVQDAAKVATYRCVGERGFGLAWGWFGTVGG